MIFEKLLANVCLQLYTLILGLVELRNAIEAEEFQDSNKPIGNNFDPHLKNTKEKMTPIEAELVEGSGLSLQIVREILEEN